MSTYDVQGVSGKAESATSEIEFSLPGPFVSKVVEVSGHALWIKDIKLIISDDGNWNLSFSYSSRWATFEANWEMLFHLKDHSDGTLITVSVDVPIGCEQDKVVGRKGSLDLNHIRLSRISYVNFEGNSYGVQTC